MLYNVGLDGRRSVLPDDGCRPTPLGGFRKHNACVIEWDVSRRGYSGTEMAVPTGVRIVGCSRTQQSFGISHRFVHTVANGAAIDRQQPQECRHVPALWFPSGAQLKLRRCPVGSLLLEWPSPPNSGRSHGPFDGTLLRALLVLYATPMVRRCGPARSTVPVPVPRPDTSGGAIFRRVVGVAAHIGVESWLSLRVGTLPSLYWGQQPSHSLDRRRGGFVLSMPISLSLQKVDEVGQ